MGLRTIGVRLTAEVSDIRRGIAQVGADMKGLAGEFDKAAKAGHLDKVADQALNMGLGLSAAFGLTVMAAAKFEKSMSQVDAATHASAADMDKLSAAALQAGKDTAYSATQAAGGIEELAKAGVTTADILGGGLTGALALAAAGQIDVAEAAETAASALTMFKLQGSDVGHVADLLAAASGKAQGGVHDMAMALNMGGLVAAQMGLSIEETVGTLAAFAKAGFLGSDAGTSLKTALLRLAAPTDVAKAEMDRLGISAFDAQGNFVGMAKFAGILQNALKDMSQEQRLAAMNVIFGADAIRASSIIYERGEKGIQEWIEAVDDSGYAADTARRKTDNLAGDVERLTGELETLAIESGSGPGQGLRFLVQAADELLTTFSKLPSGVSGTLVAFAGLSGAALLVFAAFAKMRASAAEAMVQLAATGRMGTLAATGLSRVGAAATRGGLALTGLMVVGSLVGAALHKDLNPQIDALQNSLEDMAKTGQIAGEAARLFGQDAEELDRGLLGVTATGWVHGIDQVSEALLGLVGADGVFVEGRARVAAFDQALAEMVRSGHGDQALLLLQMRAAATGLTIEQLRAALPAYAAALDVAARSTDGAAQSTELARINAAQLSGGLAAVVKEAGSLTKAWERLHGVQVSWAQAQIDVEEALDNLTESLKKNGKATDFDSEAGRNNQTAIIGVVTSARDAAQAKYDATVATKGEAVALQEANAVYNDYIARLRASLEKQGLSKQAVSDLIALYATMPPMVATTFATPGLETAITRAEKLLAYANLLGSKHAAVQFSNGEYTSGKRWGGITEHARDGLLRQAQTFSAVSTGARYAFAEPATGGEAFVPRNGDKRRSLGILDQAAGWYGHTVMPTSWTGGGAMGGTQTVVHEHHHTITLTGREMWSGFRRQVEKLGGDVQLAAGSKRS